MNKVMGSSKKYRIIAALLFTMLFLLSLISISFADVIYKHTEAKATSIELPMDALADKINNAKTVLESKEQVSSWEQLDYITFGEAALSSDPSVKNPIEWNVLEKNEETAILVSRQVLGQSEYSLENSAVQFGGEIAKWINELVSKAFTNEEQKLILSRKMLTKPDMDKYFKNAAGSMNLALTTYIRDENKKTCDYWLMNETASAVGNYFTTYGNCQQCQLGEKFGVRPVLVVKIKEVAKQTEQTTVNNVAAIQVAETQKVEASVNNTNNKYSIVSTNKKGYQLKFDDDSESGTKKVRVSLPIPVLSGEKASEINAVLENSLQRTINESLRSVYYDSVFYSGFQCSTVTIKSEDDTCIVLTFKGNITVDVRIDLNTLELKVV